MGANLWPLSVLFTGFCCLMWSVITGPVYGYFSAPYFIRILSSIGLIMLIFFCLFVRSAYKKEVIAHILEAKIIDCKHPIDELPNIIDEMKKKKYRPTFVDGKLHSKDDSYIQELEKIASKSSGSFFMFKVIRSRPVLKTGKGLLGSRKSKLISPGPWNTKEFQRRIYWSKVACNEKIKKNSIARYFVYGEHYVDCTYSFGECELLSMEPYFGTLLNPDDSLKKVLKGM